jgi:hypothetical protein
LYSGQWRALRKGDRVDKAFSFKKLGPEEAWSNLVKHLRKTPPNAGVVW